MEPYGEVGVLMNLGLENSGGEILKSLLTSSKMQKTEPVEVNILQDLETRSHQDEQIVFQIELGQSVKSEFIPNGENIIQHIPVTYLTAEAPNLTPTTNGTLVEPVTYVLSRDVLPTCCGQRNENGQKVFFVQEVESSCEPQTLYSGRKAYAAKESQTGDFKYPVEWKAEVGVKRESETAVKAKKRRKKEEEDERKVKKPLKKCKNSKLKGKTKVFQGKKPGKVAEDDKGTTSGDEKEGGNLFELTKLEDNVEQVARRLEIGCECSDSNCFDGLNPGEVFKHRLNIADLTKAEHDMYLMGVIMASIHNLEETCRHKERIRIRSCYAYQGKKVCLTAFLYLQHVTLYQMKRLRSHLKNHGVSPRIHGNRGRKPANTFSLDIYRRATTFVQKYIEEQCGKTNGGKLPCEEQKSTPRKEKTKAGGGKTTTGYHLPPECTKRIVHAEYKSYCEKIKSSQKVMKYSTFTNFLKKQFPHVKFHKREEKKPEGERWRSKEGEQDRRGREEQGGVDKSIQVDKALVYIPKKTQILINGQRMELYDESSVAGQVLVSGVGVGGGGVLYSGGQSQNSEQLYAIDSTV